MEKLFAMKREEKRENEREKPVTDKLIKRYEIVKISLRIRHIWKLCDELQQPSCIIFLPLSSITNAKKAATNQTIAVKFTLCTAGEK